MMKVALDATVAITFERVGDGSDLRNELPIARPAFGVGVVCGLRDAQQVAPTVRRGRGAARRGSIHTLLLKSAAYLPLVGTRSQAPADRPFARRPRWQRATPPLRCPRHGRRLLISEVFERRRSHRSCSAPNLAFARRRGRSLQHGARRRSKGEFGSMAAMASQRGPFTHAKAWLRSISPASVCPPQGAHAITRAFLSTSRQTRSRVRV